MKGLLRGVVAKLECYNVACSEATVKQTPNTLASAPDSSWLETADAPLSKWWSRAANTFQTPTITSNPSFILTVTTTVWPVRRIYTKMTGIPWLCLLKQRSKGNATEVSSLDLKETPDQHLIDVNKWHNEQKPNTSACTHYSWISPAAFSRHNAHSTLPIYI